MKVLSMADLDLRGEGQAACRVGQRRDLGDLDVGLAQGAQVGLGDRGNGRWRTVGIHGLLRNTFI